MHIYAINMLLTDPYVICGAPVFYLFVIKLMQVIMKDREPYQLKTSLFIYNVFQILLNIYMVYGLSNIISFPNIFGLNRPYTDAIHHYVYVHYISKYIDYLDTVFIILRGKEQQQLSFLHIYHHSTIGMIWGFLLYIGHGNGTVAFGCFTNSVIHAMMYSHYLWTSLGYDNPYKKIITQAQLLQFVLCMQHAFFVTIYETIVPRPLAFIQIIYHAQMLVLFETFYKKSYKKHNLSMSA